MIAKEGLDGMLFMIKKGMLRNSLNLGAHRTFKR